MIQKDDIRTTKDYIRCDKYRIKSSLAIESFGYYNGRRVLSGSRAGGADDKSIIYKTHNDVVNALYGSIAESLSDLSPLILALSDGGAVEVNDYLMDILQGIECLYLRYGDEKEVF